MIPELLNDDRSRRAIVHAATQPWIASPLAGVDRRPLYRVGGEQARATSLVRYAPGSHFSPHTHTGGEEFLVLEGVFEDENGRYPAGSYVRNPPGSRHAPGASGGCMIFVRLRQFHPADDRHVVAQLSAGDSQLLFVNEHERVWVEALKPCAAMRVNNPRGLEILLLEGSVTGEDFQLQPLSWMRLPAGESFQAVARDGGARLWVKDASPTLGF
ncbi:cupin domain-containing protein [Stutzerimonas azotifigens]|uniref:cupin domain-containing protein n=1 Tax=Stutzerimonas azotifigens TaxID=291995 RepID=UPI000486E327|nr:cupin domain-containing protein [Stutzerimonas azotifigens]